jgi:hypothetical protein
MTFDLESWWERSKARGNAPSGSDVYTSEDEIYNLCDGLVGDVLNHCEKEHLLAMNDAAAAYENLRERDNDGH